ncbi:uncharacterized protein LOC128391390 [Panonychus citri]|uniref:uncharacterized protein LOC128391390 n=1 Tax=Panonychus citri TaxID=50023 RepID=UPI002306FD9D|nr:uncharacterized protein LOC128391390 [Panonychus citri]
MGTIKELSSWLDSIFRQQLSVESFKSKVVRLENIGKTTKSCIRGYQQKGKLGWYNHTIHILFHIWFVIVVARAVRLIAVTDPEETFYLGDFFSEAKGKTFLHSIIIVYYILFFCSRIGAHISEVRKPMLMLKFYEKIKNEGFESIRKQLTKAKVKSFQILFYIALQFYFIGIPIVSLALLALCSTFALQNSQVTSSLENFSWFSFWVLIICIPLGINVYTLFWYYTVYISAITYCSMSLSCIDDLGDKIQSDVSKHRDLIKDYLRQQNKILNLMRSVNSDIGPVVWVGYLISTFLANFTLFLGIFIESGSSAMRFICLGLATTAYSNLTLLHFAGTAAHDKLMDIREKNFSIQAQGVKIIPPAIAVWINSTQERIENGEIGFSVTHIFIMRQSSFLFFVLENSGILMMFVANFKKS